MCLFTKKKLGKLQTLLAQMSYWQVSKFKLYKEQNNNRLLLKAFGYKFKLWQLILYHTRFLLRRLLGTTKHDYYCIMTIASKTLHQIKHNWGSSGYQDYFNCVWFDAVFCSLQHRAQVLSSSTYFKSYAVHVIRTRVSIFHPWLLLLLCALNNLKLIFSWL